MVGPPLALHQSCSEQLKQALKLNSLSSLGLVSIHLELMQKFWPIIMHRELHGFCHGFFWGTGMWVGARLMAGKLDQILM